MDLDFINDLHLHLLEPVDRGSEIFFVPSSQGCELELKSCVERCQRGTLDLLLELLEIHQPNLNADILSHVLLQHHQLLEKF
jgi:hypothetical protein